MTFSGVRSTIQFRRWCKMMVTLRSKASKWGSARTGATGSAANDRLIVSDKCWGPELNERSFFRVTSRIRQHCRIGANIESSSWCANPNLVVCRWLRRKRKWNENRKLCLFMTTCVQFNIWTKYVIRMYFVRTITVHSVIFRFDTFSSTFCVYVDLGKCFPRVILYFFVFLSSSFCRQDETHCDTW